MEKIVTFENLSQLELDCEIEERQLPQLFW